MAADGESKPQRDLPSGLVTFMFTDIVNSTTMKRQLSEPTTAERDAAFLQNIKDPHARIIKQCLEKRGGRIIEGTGDGYFIAFENPEFGVLCGLEIQEALAAAAIQTPVGPLQIRIGLHTGWAQPQGLAYTSAAADEAARVQSKVAGGMVFVSAATREHSRGIRGVETRPAGSHELKGIGPVDLFLVRRVGGPVEHASQSPKIQFTSKLPHTAERLIGREAELAMLDKAWNDPHRNVVVVRGKGGEGKTSLVAAWMAELAVNDWRGAEWVLDWSFYSQGTRDQATASGEVFILSALEHFGDPNPNEGSPEERGARLARLVSERRGLLVLDGLEPLQYPPGPMHGQLHDQGVAALLRGLAGRNTGLCVVTTREKVTEIQQHYGRSATDHPLEFLSSEAGAALLHHAGAQRAGEKYPLAVDDEELQQASREVRGHALTLFLIGQYLRLTEQGNIRRRDCLKLAEAEAEYQNDATRPYGHAFKAIEAYERWLGGKDANGKQQDEGQRQLAILRLLGLFDRPATRDCLSALRAEPAIAGLTESLAGGADKDWNIALSRLEEINLVAVNADGSVDCHPLIREYFSVRLKAEAGRMNSGSPHSALSLKP